MAPRNLALVIFHSPFSCFDQEDPHSLQAHEFLFVVHSFHTAANMGAAVAPRVVPHFGRLPGNSLP
jgi:hypothetical protein